jgi:FecR protein
MKTLASLLAIALAIVPCAALPAQNRIGEISYLENELSVTRNSRSVDAGSVQIGMEIQNLDLLKTSRAGYAEIGLDDPRASTLKLSPGTTLYLERASVGKGRKTTVGAITGSIALKVQKLGANQQVQVASETAVMGARGTAFEVTLSPAGDLLVTCSEGEVVCQEGNGPEVSAVPGSAVEQRAGEIFQRVPVAVSDLERFRKEWYAERLEVFKANPLKAIRFYALRYVALRDRFNLAYAGLAGERQVLQKWYDEDRRGQVGGNMEILREKRRIIRSLLELRKVLFVFERVHFRLSELEEYYRQGYGEGTLEGSLTSRAFFQALDRDRDVLERRMAEVRYVTKLYAKRNQGVFPMDRDLESEQDFFGDEDLGEEEDL